MNVFIDTNLLLDFFRMSSDDLDELKKIARLHANGSITLFISDWVRDEFERNREKVIDESLTQFEKSNLVLHLPNIVRSHDDSVVLDKLKRKFRELITSVSRQTRAEAESKETAADTVIDELFATVELQDEATIFL